MELHRMCLITPNFPTKKEKEIGKPLFSEIDSELTKIYHHIFLFSFQRIRVIPSENLIMNFFLGGFTLLITLVT